ncbi:MAG: shikimate dehydrogenase [Pedobacter sp.]|nr:MAG: shikimate dehydrogenase [Pedobacter sp.]
MRKFGLIGFPLSHSFSKRYFSEKFAELGIADCSYELFPISAISELPQLLQAHSTLRGLNVTIPYKIEVLPYLTTVDSAAQLIGAVNCIHILHNSESSNLKLIGYNTDAHGFQASLSPLLNQQHNFALILGDGGAAQAVKYVLNQLGIGYQLVTRRPQSNSIRYAELDAECIQKHKLIINTTPLGMSPDLNAAPILPYEYLSSEHLVYDLVYNPEKTKFLQLAEQSGAKIKNGMEMLILQAERAWEIWNSRDDI